MNLQTMDIYKVLILGNPQTGKSTIVKQILGDDVSRFRSHDFVLKILRIEDQRARIQIWDTPSGATSASAFSPLFVRNAVGAIIVANPSQPRSLTDAAVWKRRFDECI